MPEKLPNVSFGIHKKQVYSFGIHKKQAYNPPTSQETLRLQPATVVCNRYEIISKSGLGKRFRKPQTAAGFVPKACETQARKTLETSPTEPTKRKEKRWPPGRKAFTLLESFRERLELWPWDIACQSLEQQPDSCPRHAKQTLETSLTEPTKRKRKKKRWPPARKTFAGLVPRSSRNLALEYRLRKPRTAAGFVPKACKTQANKTLETSPTEPTKKKEKERKKIASRPSDIARNNSTIARYARLESRRHHLEIWLWKTLPKASNSSRIRGQGMQNTSQKNSRNVADGTH